MQTNLQHVRQNQVTTHTRTWILRARLSTTTFAYAKYRIRRLPALVYPLAISHTPASREAPRQPLYCSYIGRWTSKGLDSGGSVWEHMGRGRLGQDGPRRCFSTTSIRPAHEHFKGKITQSLLRAESELLPDDLTSWRRLFTHMREKHGDNGIWACFELLRERHHLHLLLRKDGKELRDEIIGAALNKDTRLETLREVVLRLESFSRHWPDFHVTIVHSLLESEAFDRALKWHLELSRQFPLGPDVLGGVFSSFITDPRPEMQDALTSIYVSSAERKLYDHIIPVLYNSGLSQLARAWRRKLIRLGDYPSSTRSLPFLDFLSQYYPQIPLTHEERVLVRHRQGTVDECDPKSPFDFKALPKRRAYHDGFLANMFASTWLSVEFVINLTHRWGLQMIGPQSLQALALREANAADVAGRINQLERLDICIAPQTYCKTLAFFAKKGEDKLLSQLLHTDVHPDEFDDPNTRHMIMAAAVKERDWQREELFQGVEWAIENETNPDHLNMLLRDILLSRKLGKSKVVVDRMEALKVKITPKNAATLLSRAFWGVGKHPTRWKRKIPRGEPDYQLDRAIEITRKIASHDIGIPLRYWESLIYSLGRWGRVEELLQLSHEIVQLFKPVGGGLIAVDHRDLPQISQPNAEPAEVTMEPECTRSVSEQTQKHKSKQRSEDVLKDTRHIAADLPFTHRQHPLQKLFDTRLQRNIVRWGFDQTLAKETAKSASRAGSAMRLADFDIACGVRILASLRDHGVLIDTQIIRSTIASRIVLGQIPPRRHQTRGPQDVTTENVKRLVDEAWGSEVLPSIPELNMLVERQRLDVWKRYPRLFQSTYGEGLARELDEDL